MRHIFYNEIETPFEKSQKDLNNVYKKIKKNKNYFYSAKDLALIESLKADGFLIPKEIKYNEISKNYSVPENLINLLKNDEIGRLALKFVVMEEGHPPYELDPETLESLGSLLKFQKYLLSLEIKLD